ncbi:MAG: type II toxin-antitoxin system VapC family toxin [Acidobacteria bacterium]|nr:type II toxin-antitoxin system VapC family toxin [Acidobacteriota bacterium]
MDYLADTNIILRLAEPAHPMHDAALKAVAKLFSDGQNICLLPQNLIEFWNVATRPADKNGFGWTANQTDAEVTVLESTFTILPDTPAIYTEWRRLVADHSVLGKQVHDTRIVAAMNVYQITRLLTFNAADFRRFSNIVLINPTTV